MVPLCRGLQSFHVAIQENSHDHALSPRLSGRFCGHGRLTDPACPRRAQSARMSLTATTRTIDVRGRAATVWGLMDGNGRSGLVLDPGQAFAVDLTNTLAEPTIIHWHGQIPPNAQDGVPDLPMPTLQPGESRAYDFAARAGHPLDACPYPRARDAAAGRPSGRAATRGCCGRSAGRDAVPA